MLRPPNAGVFSWRPEISACRSRGSERSDDSEPRVVRLGCGVREQCPVPAVSRKRDLLPVSDLKLPLHFALIWRNDNASPLLATFVAEVRSLPEVEAYSKR